MKRVLLLVGVICCLTGCGNETKTMTCTRTVNQNGIKMDLRYEVEYSKNTVIKVKSIEKVTSDSPEVLETYKQKVESIYANAKDIEHYDTEVKIDGDTMTSTATIDYSKIDTDKLIQIDSSLKNLIKDGKVNIDDMKSIYESSSVGATCEK